VRRFNSIKKSRKKSKDIDEKIEYLNKECQKTGLYEVTNSTSGVYVGTQSNPNQGYVEITSVNFNGYPFGMSGDSNLGQGNFGGAGIRADGAALSPPHPTTGVRTTTSTKGSLGTKLAIPGERLTPESRMTGPVLWYYDPNAAFGQGAWKSLEFNSASVHGNQPFPFTSANAGWGYWGSNFSGFPLLRSDGEAFASLFAALNDSEGNQFDPQNSVPTTVVLIKNDLGDPNFLPINIPDLATQAFEYLKGKAQQALEGGKNLFNQAVAGAFPKNPNNNYAPDLAGSIAANEVRTYENEDIPDEQKQNLINNMNWLDIGKNIPITSQPTNYSDDNFYVNDNGDVTPHSGDSKNKFPPNTHTHQGDTKKYGDNPLANAGEFQFELVVPPDGSEPYFNYEDHAYYNPNSKDKGEVPDAVRNALANLSQAAGQQLPGYPDGIKGDVVKKVQIPLSDAIKFNPKIKLAPALSGMFKESLDESVNLGHFDPEVLNVDINDIRKGIMPEFPKDPPPEMISGYSAKSRLAPKTITGEPFIKIKRKDLARNHKLTDKEISEFMSDIEMINDYIKQNPAELKYAMIRYPKDDPRLAQLNYKMDQMKAASDEYMETHFPENQKLFNRLQQKISNTIGQTDPQNFKGHTPPPQFTDESKINEQRKRIVSKHFNKSVKIKKLFRG